MVSEALSLTKFKNGQMIYKKKIFRIIMYSMTAQKNFIIKKFRVHPYPKKSLYKDCYKSIMVETFMHMLPLYLT